MTAPGRLWIAAFALLVAACHRESSNPPEPSRALPPPEAGPSFSIWPDLFTVRETVLRYLPETLANYVALPPVFRATRVLTDGKTARQLLSEQLALLDEKLGEVVANVAASDAQALLANGRFLEMRFKQPDFLVR